MNSLEKFNSYPEYESYTDLVKRVDPNKSPHIVTAIRASNPISSSGKKLGIFSGSFNPLTLAHSKMVEKAYQDFELDEMLLLIAKANVDKPVFGWPIEARILTLKLHSKNKSYISIAVSSHGRYIDKITALKQIYPMHTEFYFIVGYDTLVRIFDPKYYNNIHEELDTLFSQCRFIVANRKGVSINDIKYFLNQPSFKSYQRYIDFLTLSEYYANLSSTDIRNRINRGDEISHLVPPSISYFLE
ncbi:nicotinate-nicotinamide nucleotide adenylyltransferase [Candidatus Poribacteria bacterium]|nr:nicotinate-nicotinamide nucleotide adenylyltransferase [Candidatus Poribacteria bacterium]